VHLQQLVVHAPEFIGSASVNCLLTPAVDDTVLLLFLQADVQEVSSRLSSSSCILPAYQLQLIEEFRSLVRTGPQSYVTAAAAAIACI
jgi:hypothetical protein